MDPAAETAEGGAIESILGDGERQKLEDKVVFLRILCYTIALWNKMAQAAQNRFISKRRSL